MLKRILCAVLSFAMLLTLLCACGSSGDSSSDTSDNTSNDTAATEAPVDNSATDAEETEAPEEVSYFPLEEEGDLSIFMSFIPPVVAQIGDDPTTYTVWREMSSRLNVYIDFMPTTHDVFTEKTMIILSGGDYPDIMMNLLEQAYSFSGDRALSDGTVVDLTDVVEEYMPNYSKYLFSSDKYMKDGLTDDGKVAAVFGLWDGDVGADYGPVIRQDWLDELNLDTPVTYDDYYNVLTAFKNELGATAPIWFSNDGCLANNYLASGFGTVGCTGTAYSSFFKVVDGKVIFCATTDEFKEYITTMNKWYSEGLILNDYFDASYDRSYIDDGLIAADATGIWYIRDEYYNGYYDALSEDPDFNMVAIEDAVKTVGGESHLTTGVNVVSTNHACVTTGCEDVELACRFLDYIFTDDGMILFNYGVEGEGFNYVDGKPVLSDLILNNPDGLSTTSALTKYAQQQGVMLMDVGRFDVIYSQEDLSPWNAHDDDWVFPSMASATADESDTIAKIMGDVYTYMNENVTKFIVGENSLDSWDSYLATLNNFDIPTVTSILQDIYDRYASR